MEEQSSYNNVEDSGFMLFKRKKMLLILEKHILTTKNNILIDYYDNLKELDKKTKSFEHLKLSDWDWYSWQGFYSKLQKKLNQGEWNYVSNRGGGFLGFWWNWHYSSIEEKKFQYYLQLEQNKMVFKLSVEDANERYRIRDILFKKTTELNVNILKYGRIGN